MDGQKDKETVEKPAEATKIDFVVAPLTNAWQKEAIEEKFQLITANYQSDLEDEAKTEKLEAAQAHKTQELKKIAVSLKSN